MVCVTTPKGRVTERPDQHSTYANQRLARSIHFTLDFLPATALTLAMAMTGYAAPTLAQNLPPDTPPRKDSPQPISTTPLTDKAEYRTRFGLNNQTFQACFPNHLLTARKGEKRPVKGVSTFDRPPKALELAPAFPIPAGLRGSIRRVKIHGDRKLIALTLDLCEQRREISGYDGDIFDYLRKHKIKATVFVGGKWFRSHEMRATQLIADPLFEIANHAEAHRNLRGLTGKRLLAEITGPQQAYESLRAKLTQNACVTNHPNALAQIPNRIGLFRFPFGACNRQSIAAVNDAGLLAIQWDISSGDPSPKMSGRAIARQIVRNAKPGSIIITHANGRGFHTAQGLPIAIPKLLAKGYEFVTISELLASGTPEITPGCYDSRPGDTDRYDRFIARPKQGRNRNR